MKALSRHKWKLIAVSLPIAMNAVAFAAFRMQGGFGGGHGRYDQIIGCLEFPGILLIDDVPVWLAIHLTDLTLILIVPFVVNLGLAVVIGALIDWARARRAPPRGFDVGAR